MMSAIAQVLHDAGWQVSGSDRADGAALRRLAALGINVHVGHDAANVPDDCALVLASSAVRPGNPELVRAGQLGIPIWDKGRILRQFMAKRRGIGVAGTHGKTTTTAMIGHILTLAGMDPLVLVGGDAVCLGGNYRPGKGAFMVTETDESDGSFLGLLPEIAVVTNADRDHLDYWGSFDRLLSGFQQFMQAVPQHGLAVICGDDRHLPQLAEAAGVPFLSYGLGESNRMRAGGFDHAGQPSGSRFRVALDGVDLGPMRLTVPGRHNVLNALAASAAAMQAGVPWPVVSEALASFSGVKRRLERKGTISGISVLDDYAHHPTEVRATLAALRPQVAGRVFCVFQPHRYTRTKDVHHEFGESFDLADRLILMDIYPAGEPPITGVSSGLILEAVRARQQPAALHLADPGAIVETLAGLVRPGDAVVTVGAGDVYRVGEDLMQRLRGLQTTTEEPSSPGTGERAT
jgi:UDP-N-acetylmuramate--alanine ligase